MPVVTEENGETVGTVSGIVVHPDLGRIEGCFVRVSGFLRADVLFLPCPDILHWGQRLRVRSQAVIAPFGELVRLRQFVADGRTVLGQRILTESGSFIGVCRDVQFETKTFRLEWLFPKRFLRWRRPIPASAIVDVRREAVVVRDLAAAARESVTPSVLKTIQELTEAPVPPREPEAA